LTWVLNLGTPWPHSHCSQEASADFCVLSGATFVAPPRVICAAGTALKYAETSSGGHKPKTKLGRKRLGLGPLVIGAGSSPFETALAAHTSSCTEIASSDEFMSVLSAARKVEDTGGPLVLIDPDTGNELDDDVLYKVCWFCFDKGRNFAVTDKNTSIVISTSFGVIFFSPASKAAFVQR
jgi:hypothetical protein